MYSIELAWRIWLGILLREKRNMAIAEQIKNLCSFGGVLEECLIQEEGMTIAIDSSNSAIAEFLSARSPELRECAIRAKSSCLCVVLKVRGVVVHTIPLRAKTHNHTSIMAQSTSVSVLNQKISSYQELLEIAYNSQHATYITLLPENWHWGMPIKCILTSQAVKSFTGRNPFMLHGEDVTRLYDKEEMERQTLILTREIERSPRDRVLIKDVEYLTYSSDISRSDVIQKDHAKKWRYNADFQVMFLDDIGYVRVCSCKERVPV